MSILDNTILVTGVAGFIGSAVVEKLLSNGEKVIGIDNLNSYYDQNLKNDRLKNIEKISSTSNGTWKFEKIELEDTSKLKNIFKTYKPEIVINLAAQAGVRFSIENPHSYILSNLVGFGNILESCKEFKVKNLIYASSSSVYGGNTKIPFKEDDSVDHPKSLYAATKRSNELMAHSYSHLFDIPSTGLRFFTVYGPWGRPDMAPMIFAEAIFNRKPLKIYNFGKMLRDFTFIDDVVEAIVKCCYKPATANKEFNFTNPTTSNSFAPHRIFNVGNSNPIELTKFICLLESFIGIKAIKVFEEIQPGDVVATAANTEKLENWINFQPKIPIEVGLEFFVEWYKKYYCFV